MAIERLHWVLVHGALHGAWVYYKTMALLQQEGYKVTAVDLASCGTSTVDPNTVTDFKTYNQPLINVLNAIPDTEQVVLVAHSMGGLSMTHAMEEFPHKIVLAIAVAGLLLLNGASLDDSPTFSDMLFKDTPLSKALIPNFGNGPKNLPTTFSIDKEDLPKLFYHAVLPEVSPPGMLYFCLSFIPANSLESYMKAIDLRTVLGKPGIIGVRNSQYACFEITVKPRWEDYYLGDVASCKLINLRVQVW